MKENAARPRQRIGPWRLLDIVTATMPGRAATFGMSASLPEYGPPDAVVATPDPVELPGSNIAEHERREAVSREAARRFVRRERA
jgi:hypothetical protein